MRNYTIEDIQKINQRPTPLPPGFKSIPFTIPNEYRERAAEKLAPLLEPFKADIGWDWQQDECEPITGEWIIPEDLMNDQDTPNIDIPTLLYYPGGAYHICSIQTHRFLTSRAAKVKGTFLKLERLVINVTCLKLINSFNVCCFAIDQHGKCKTFAINYRLAPQHPFPAAIIDSLAAYLYLTNPPEDAGFSAIDVSKLVMGGDSAGGGLVIATALAIRNLQLPAPAGVVALSPWYVEMNVCVGWFSWGLLS
jgi:acetyl esterase/lipase